MARTKKIKIGNYIPRGYELGDDFMKNLKSYQYIIKYANNPKNGLDIQLRGKYINIYYAGGNLLKLSGTNTCEFDENYFYLPTSNDLCMTDIERLCSEDYINKVEKSKALKTLKLLGEAALKKKRELAIQIKRKLKKDRDNIIKKLSTCSSYEETSQVLEEMKSIMTNWKKKNGKKQEIGERLVQHYLSLNNKEFDADTDFVVLDIEYAISSNARYAKEEKREQQPRMDIIAIEKDTGQLYVMELKYGLDAADGDAGIKDHYDDYLATVGADEKWHYFWDDIEVLLKAKNDFIYENNKNDITLKKSKPYFAFILKEQKDGDEAAFKQKLIDNELSFVPTIYLPKESDYNNPSVIGHKLSKRYIK